jgi:hypothetical protein
LKFKVSNQNYKNFTDKNMKHLIGTRMWRLF